MWSFTNILESIIRSQPAARPRRDDLESQSSYRAQDDPDESTHTNSSYPRAARQRSVSETLTRPTNFEFLQPPLHSTSQQAIYSYTDDMTSIHTSFQHQGISTDHIPFQHQPRQPGIEPPSKLSPRASAIPPQSSQHDDANIYTSTLCPPILDAFYRSPPPPLVHTFPAPAQLPNAVLPPSITIEPYSHRACWGVPLVQLSSSPANKPTNLSSQGSIRASDTPGILHTPAHVAFAELCIHQLIGEGVFGKVYRGVWQGSPVAIKLATASNTRIPTTRLMGAKEVEVKAPEPLPLGAKEFQQEVAIMSSIPRHENVLSLLAVCSEPKTLALVTEYCPGGSLFSLLHSNPNTPLPWGTVLSTAIDIARGMCHLHMHDVLHRDLKSPNLLISESGHIKIADFGLSRIYTTTQKQGPCDSSASLKSPPLTGGLGTYQWTAPEVLAHQRYSDKADVYSFGVVLWELLTRRLPYGAMSGLQAAMNVVHNGLRPPIPENAPSEIVSLMRACWAAVPDQRPSFQDIARKLEEVWEKLHIEEGVVDAYVVCGRVAAS